MKNPYRGYIRPSLLTAAGGLALALALNLAGGTAAVLGWTIGGVTALAGAICALTFHLSARRADKHLQAFGRGEYLARWTYSAAEWRAFAADEWARIQKKAARMPLWGGATGAFVGLLCWEALGPAGIPALAALGGAVGWGIGRTWLSYGRSRFVAEQAAPEAVIGDGAALLNGRYVGWTGLGEDLYEAKLVELPIPALEVTVRSSSGRNANYHTHRFPVPAGREGEARGVLQALGF